MPENVQASDPDDSSTRQPQQRPGLILCLSGGGYRAMLFHVGALWRMNQGGMLNELSRISSVSGGSIAAGFLWSKWLELGLDRLPKGTPVPDLEWQNIFVDPLRAFAHTTVDIKASLYGLIFQRPGEVISAAYREHLVGNVTLQQLPDKPDSPRFVLNATNLQSGVLCRFSRPYLWDYRVGKIENPKIPLATATAASSAFPPFLSPVVLRFRNSDFTPNSGGSLQIPPYTTKMKLADGGIYDNLGLQTVDSFTTVFVSDGGERMTPMPRPKSNWLNQLILIPFIVDNQVRSLRRSHFIKELAAGTRQGAFWGIGSDISKYELSRGLTCPVAQTALLAQIPTRLANLTDLQQMRLINWGYAACDAALQTHYYRTSKPSEQVQFPYPAAGVSG
jgi:NTE family protein